MYKSVRSLSLALLLTLAAVPAVKADRWGTNPRPEDSSNAVSVMMDALMFNLGIL